MAQHVPRANSFCWIDVHTPQPARAREFFARLLGWEYTAMPSMGHTVQVGGRDIGTLLDVASPGIPGDAEPHVGVVVGVASAAETCRKVRELDGIASTAFEPMGQGQMAVCIDPTGGQFDIWEPSNGPRTGVDSSLHGAPSWFELTTGDIDRAAAFYSGLFGWTPEFLPVPGSKCAVFKLGELRVAGLLSLTPHMLSQRSRWETFFTVRDVDQAARDALDLGATLSEPVLEVAGIGRFCGITSPQGLAFHLIAHAR